MLSRTPTKKPRKSGRPPLSTSTGGAPADPNATFSLGNSPAKNCSGLRRSSRKATVERQPIAAKLAAAADPPRRPITNGVLLSPRRRGDIWLDQNNQILKSPLKTRGGEAFEVDLGTSPVDSLAWDNSHTGELLLDAAAGGGNRQDRDSVSTRHVSVDNGSVSSDITSPNERTAGVDAMAEQAAAAPRPSGQCNGSASSDNGRGFQAPPTLAADTLTSHATAIEIEFQDEFSDFNPSKCTLTYLEKTLDDIFDLKQRLSKLVYSMVVENVPSQQVERYRQLKREILDLIYRVQADIQERRAAEVAAAAASTPAPSNAAGNVAQPTPAIDQAGQIVKNSAAATASVAAAAQVKTSRVSNNEASLTYSLDAIIKELDALGTESPTTNKEVKVLSVKYEEVVSRAGSYIKEASALCEDAISVGMVKAAENLDKMSRDANNAVRDTGAALRDIKLSAGLLGSSGPSSKAADIPAPRFGGGSAEDLYEFLDKYEAYTGSRADSKVDQLKVLKETCLTGAVGEACKWMDTEKEILKYLKVLYGQPRTLLDSKVREFKRLGKCPGTPALDRRDWLVRALSQMETLVRICGRHNLLPTLYHSEVMHEYYSALPYTIQREYLSRMSLLPSSETSSEEEDTFKETLEFARELVKKATSDVRTGLILGIKEDKKAAEKQKPPVKKVMVTQPAEPAESAGEQTDSYVPKLFRGFGKAPGVAGAPRAAAREEEEAYAVDSSLKPRSVACKLCNGSHTHIFFCPEFQEARVRNRFPVIKAVGACMRCLRMDSEFDVNDRPSWWSRHERYCLTDWPCSVDWCGKNRKEKQMHFTMCARHTRDNKGKQDEFIRSLDPSLTGPETRFFFSDVFFGNVYELEAPAAPLIPPDVEVIEGCDDPAIYLLQDVATESGEKLLLFFDSGCSQAALSDRAVDLLPNEVVVKGPTNMGVAGGKVIELKGGINRFWLDTWKEREKVSMVGSVMPEITTPLRVFHLHAAFETISNWSKENQDPALVLPSVPDQVGGQAVDVMVGIRYSAWYPVPVIQLPSGLAIYSTRLRTASGRKGILGGPHKSWKDAVYRAETMNPLIFLCAEIRSVSFSNLCLRDPMQLDFCHAEVSDEEDDLPTHLISSQVDQPMSTRFPGELGKVNWCEVQHCRAHSGDNWRVPKHWTVDHLLYTHRGALDNFDNLEGLGSEMTYRCVRCRNCNACRNGEFFEKTSLIEEAEQALIEDSVWLDHEEAVLRCRLPFIKDPTTALAPNQGQVKKILDSQMRAIGKSEAMRESVLIAHDKLYSKGHVAAYDELSEEERISVDTAAGSYYIPWSVVAKEGSVSTPFRVVFNASHRTKTGESLNSVLAKGMNKLPQILHLLIRFGSKKEAVTGDVSMAYNNLKVVKEHFTYQRYLWVKDLKEENGITEMFVRTMIYGVKAAGGACAAGFTHTADYALEHYPDHAAGANVIKFDTYVDDAATAADTKEECKQLADSMSFVLALGGMSVKAFSFSGAPPSELVSADGESTGLLGYIWWPVKDMVSLSIKDLYLGKAKKGRAPPPVTGCLRTALAGKFTRRVITGKVMSVYDPMGYATPVTAQLKLDLAEIVSLKCDWDDPIPQYLLDKWVANLRGMQELRDLKFHRSYIHPDAVSDRLEIIVSVDASQHIAVATVHARSKLPDGSHSCRLVVAKSKLVHTSTIPKGELRAAVMGATLGHVVLSNLRDRVDKVMYVTDSTIVLFWLNQDTRPLHTGVRNSVIEVRRLSDVAAWRHVESSSNIADVGTRPVNATCIGSDSEWTLGKDWMSIDWKDMPVRTVDNVKLTMEEIREAKKEVRASDIGGYILVNNSEKMAQRYDYSKFLVDPARMLWKKSVRILALVRLFIIKCCKKTFKNPLLSLYRREQGESSSATPAPPPSEAAGCVSRGEKPLSDMLATTTTEEAALPPPTLVPDQLIAADGYPRLKLKLPAHLKVPSVLFSADTLLTDEDIQAAEDYFFRKATKEVLQFSKDSDFKKCSVMKDKVLYYTGRILDGQCVDDVENIMPDLSPLHFSRPFVDRYSPIAYSVMVYVHEKVVNHRNPVVVLRASREICYIISGRDLANEVAAACPHCRRYKAKVVAVEMGKQHPARLTIAPAFYRCQVDLAGPFIAYCEHNCRSTVKVHAAVFKDPASGAVAVYAMQGQDAASFIQCFNRHSYRYGIPQKLFIDAGTQLVKSCKKGEISWADITNSLVREQGVGIDFEVCPPHAHYMHGVVERSIKDIKAVLETVFGGYKLSLFGYETAFAFAANELNCLPLSLGSRTDDLGSTDLITPSRLLLGRNNKRAPLGITSVTASSKVLDELAEIQKSWWKTWASETIINFVPQPKKWLRNNTTIKKGNIVVFVKANGEDDSIGDTSWRIGRVDSFEDSRDGRPRKVTISYKIPGEVRCRKVTRGLREVAVLHEEGELELAEQLNAAAKLTAHHFWLERVRNPDRLPSSWSEARLDDMPQNLLFAR